MSMLRTFIAVAALLMATNLARAEDALQTGQTIIRQQIEAFLNDDAVTAYSFASPAIKKRFPNQDIFFDMVKRMYGPVFRPGGFAFSRAVASSDEKIIMQEVLISGRDGRSWSALYQLTLQDDGNYKINGVQMFQDMKSKGI